MQILVATDREVLVIDVERGTSAPARGIGDRPYVPGSGRAGSRACMVWHPPWRRVQERRWRKVLATDRSRGPADYGRRCELRGAGRRVGRHRAERSVALRGCREFLGANQQTWTTLPSSSEWSFPPRPETHHVRWIACHPLEPERLWVAIEAGALVSTIDGGRTWRDRVPGGPWDTHELAIHRKAPDTLRVSAGDGYYESYDAGATWHSPQRRSRGRLLAQRGDRSGATGGRRRISLVRTTLRVRRWSLGWPAVPPCRPRALGARARRLAGASQHNRASAQRRHEGWRSCGPRMNVACTVRMTAGRAGGAWPAMLRRRSTCEALRSCANVQSRALPHRRQ